MKKTTRIIALIIALVMICATVSTTLVSAEYFYDTIEKPEGINIWYATDVSDNEPVYDGMIDKGEYGDPIRITTPKALKNSDWGGSWEPDGRDFDDTLASEYMDVYFAYDEDYIYFAFYELGASPVNTEDDDVNTFNNVPFRNNYRFEFGLELDNVGNFFRAEAGSNNAWKIIDTFHAGTRKVQSEVTFDQFSEVIVSKKDVNTGEYIGFGDFYTNANKNYVGGQWELTVEWKFDKAGFIDAWNQIYGTEYNDLSNAMWVSLTTNAFRCVEPNYEEPFDSQYFRWLGQNDITGKGSNYADYGARATSTSMPDLVVFGSPEDDLIMADPFPPIYVEPETNPPIIEYPTTDSPKDEETVLTAPETFTPEIIAPESTGLRFRSKDGICYLAGIGNCTDTEIVVPSVSPSGEIVTAVDGYAFFRAPIKSIVLPGTIKEVGTFAFSDSKLEEVKFSSGISVINAWSFSTCSSLRSITIPATVTTIEEGAFSNCCNLETIYFEGNEEEWELIDKTDRWDYEAGAYTPNGTYTVVYNTILDTGVIETETEEERYPETKAPDTTVSEDEATDTGVLNEDESVTFEEGTIVKQEDVTNAPAVQIPSIPNFNFDLSGCAGTVSVAGLALVATLGTCVAFVSKKKD